MNCLHPQDLRTIGYAIGNPASSDPWKEAASRVILALVERVFSDGVEPTRTCSEVDETAPVPDYGPPALHFPWVAIHHDELNALRAEVGRLKVELAESRGTTQSRRASPGTIKTLERSLIEKGATQERERILAIIEIEVFDSFICRKLRDAITKEPQP